MWLLDTHYTQLRWFSFEEILNRGGYAILSHVWNSQEDTFQHYSAISLMFDGFNEFPTGLDCPNLKLLQLQGSYQGILSGDCTKFDSGDFFEVMRELRVVSLRSMFLQLPPPPLKSLMNLRTLCLDFCKLDTTDISMVGSLKSLEILSFFQCLP